MALSQYLINGLLQGGLYACIAVGFSLVWGVLNVVNMLHGAMVVLGAYLTLYGSQKLGLPLYAVMPAACAIIFVIGYGVQRGFINRVIGQPILITLTLTFGLELIVHNLLLQFFTATPQSLLVNMGAI